MTSTVVGVGMALRKGSQNESANVQEVVVGLARKRAVDRLHVIPITK